MLEWPITCDWKAKILTQYLLSCHSLCWTWKNQERAQRTLWVPHLVLVPLGTWCSSHRVVLIGFIHLEAAWKQASEVPTAKVQFLRHSRKSERAEWKIPRTDDLHAEIILAWATILQRRSVGLDIVQKVKGFIWCRMKCQSGQGDRGLVTPVMFSCCRSPPI